MTVQVTDRNANHYHQAMVDETQDRTAPAVIPGMRGAFVEVGTGYAVSPGVTDLHAGPTNSMQGSLWACGWFHLTPWTAGLNPEAHVLLRLISSGDMMFGGGICFELAVERYSNGDTYLRGQRVNGPGGPPHTAQVARSVNIPGLALGHHYVAIKYDQPSNTWSFYLDGSTITTGAIINPTVTNPTDSPRAYMCGRGPNERWYAAIAWGTGTPTAAALNAMYTTRASGSAAYQTAALALSGCMSYWSLDEFPRGTMKDSSGNYNDGMYDDLPNGVFAGTGMPPGSVKCAQLNGSYAVNGGWGTYIDGANLNNSFAIFGLIDNNEGAAGFVPTFLHLQDDSFVDRILLTYSNDPVLNEFLMKLYRQTGDSGTLTTFTMAAIPALADGPHTLAVDFNTTTNAAKFYVDGVLSYTVDLSGSGAALATPITRVGILGGGEMNTRLSHFAVFGSVLTAPNHANLKAQSLVSSAALVSALQALP